MTRRLDAAKALAVVGWGIVRYAGCVVAYELHPTAVRLAAEHRWHDEVEKRWLAFRLTRDEWRNAR